VLGNSYINCGAALVATNHYLLAADVAIVDEVRESASED
jgi:hypothetical protein